MWCRCWPTQWAGSTSFSRSLSDRCPVPSRWPGSDAREPGARSFGPEPERHDYHPAMGLLTPLAVRIGAISWMPRLLPQVVAVDKALQRLSRGRVSVLDVAGLPNLSLTAPGRKSGEPRT